MKQIFKLSLLLLALLLPATATAYDFMVGGIAYNINGNEVSVTYTDSTNTFSHNYSGLTIAMTPSSVTYGGTNYSVTAIGESAFSNCGTMTSVTIPNTIKSSAVGAFRDCNALTRVNISDLQAWCKIYFRSGNSNPLCYAHHLYLNGNKITDLVIPESLTSINSCVFWGCSAKSVTIPSTINSIGWCAFMNCDDLEKVIISSIEAWCKIQFVSGGSNPLNSAHHLYLNESEITDLVIPNSITSIRYGAFWSCSGLKSVTIPNSVTSISDKAFYGCGGLNDVFSFIADPTNVSMGSDVFVLSSNNYAARTLHVSVGTLSAYQADTKWSSYFGSIVEMEPEPVLAESIKLNVTTAGLNEGSTLQLTATVLPENSDKTVHWASNNPSVATIDSNGLVTTHSVGTAIITAMTADGSNLSTTCTVTLLPVGLKGDVNGDTNINISDVTKLIDYLLSGCWD